MYIVKGHLSNLAGYESEGGKEMGLGELETKYRFEMNSLL